MSVLQEFIFQGQELTEVNSISEARAVRRSGHVIWAESVPVKGRKSNTCTAPEATKTLEPTNNQN